MRKASVVSYQQEEVEREDAFQLLELVPGCRDRQRPQVLDWRQSPGTTYIESNSQGRLEESVQAKTKIRSDQSLSYDIIFVTQCDTVTVRRFACI